MKKYVSLLLRESASPQNSKHLSHQDYTFSSHSSVCLSPGDRRHEQTSGLPSLLSCQDQCQHFEKFQRSVFILHYSDLVVSHTMWVFAPSTSSSKPPPQNLSHSHENHSVSISIATWNCRGLHNSIPYIQHLISINVDIIVLQEHWPWPFQWNSLQYIHIRSVLIPFCVWVHISPYPDLRRGCGGVAIFWSQCHSTPSPWKWQNLCYQNRALPNSPDMESTCLALINHRKSTLPT